MTSRIWLWVKNNSILTSSTIAFSFLLMLATPQSASAQLAGNGAISGSITDSSGAAVAGAQVTAVQVETGSKYDRASSGTGAYVSSPLQPGLYSVTVVALRLPDVFANQHHR